MATHEQRTTAERSRKKLSSRPSVLLVDDDEISRMVGRIVLETAGFSVEIATGGSDAIERTRTQRYDLILMDLNMPDTNGCEAARTIRSLEREDNKPLIYATSASPSQVDRSRARAAGMDGCLDKPLEIEELRSLAARISR